MKIEGVSWKVLEVEAKGEGFFDVSGSCFFVDGLFYGVDSELFGEDVVGFCLVKDGFKFVLVSFRVVLKFLDGVGVSQC